MLPPFELNLSTGSVQRDFIRAAEVVNDFEFMLRIYNAHLEELDRIKSLLSEFAVGDKENDYYCTRCGSTITLLAGSRYPMTNDKDKRRLLGSTGYVYPDTENLEKHLAWHKSLVPEEPPADFAVGQRVVVREDIDQPDPVYEGLAGVIRAFEPDPNGDIPWRVAFDDGREAGFEASELRPEKYDPATSKEL